MYHEASCVALIAAAAACNNKTPCVTVSYVLEILQCYHIVQKSLQLILSFCRYLKRWTSEWEADLEARPEEAKDSSSGTVATTQFAQTMSFFKPLFKQLKRRQVGCLHHCSVICQCSICLAPLSHLQPEPFFWCLFCIACMHLHAQQT